MDVPGERLPADLPSYLRAHVAPEVPAELRASFLEAVGVEGNIRTMQNKQLTSKPLHQPGGWGCNLLRGSMGGGGGVMVWSVHTELRGVARECTPD